jgi:hypothetical protein
MPLSSGDGHCPEGRKSLRGRLGQTLPPSGGGACHLLTERRIASVFEFLRHIAFVGIGWPFGMALK